VRAICRVLERSIESWNVQYFIVGERSLESWNATVCERTVLRGLIGERAPVYRVAPAASLASSAHRHSWGRLDVSAAF